MNCRKAAQRDESVFAARAVNPAIHRKPLAVGGVAAYSSIQRSTTHRLNRREDRTMKTISTQARVISFLAAALMSASVLGATVAGMQSGVPTESQQLVVLERATSSATATN
jgi:hypothetical protein